MGSNFLHLGRVDQASAGHHDSLYLGKVLTLLHKGLAHHGIGLLDGTCVTGNCLFYRKRCQCKIQCFQLRIAIRNLIGMGS